MERGGIERRLGELVLDEVAERGVLLLADRLLERDGQLRHPQDLAHLRRGDVELGGDLVWPRVSPQTLNELAFHMDDLVELLDHVDGDANSARLVRDRARDGLPYPPGRVGRELVALAVVELLDRTDEAERAFLDEIEKRETPAEVPLRDRDDEAQVRLDHLGLGAHVAALDPLRQVDLLIRGEQRDAADLAQVEAE